MKRRLAGQDEQDTRLMILKISVIVMIVVMVFTALAVPFLLSRDSSMPSAPLVDYPVGSLTDDDVIARQSFSFIDEEATQQLVQEASKAVLPLFSFSLNKTLSNLSRTDAFIDLVYDYSDDPQATYDQAIAFFQNEGIEESMVLLKQYAQMSDAVRTRMLKLLRESIREMLSLGLYSSSDFEHIEQQGYHSFLLENNIELQDYETPIEKSIAGALTENGLEKVMFKWMSTYSQSLMDVDPAMLLQSLRLLATPNIQYDEFQTMQLRNEAAQAVAPVVISIEKGDYILRQDTVVTEETAKIMRYLQTSTIEYTLLEQIGRFFFVVICTLGGLFAFKKLLPTSEHRALQYFLMLLVVVTVSLIGSYFVVRLTRTLVVPSLDPFLPVLLAPVFISLACSNKKLGIIAAFFMAVYSMLLPESNPMTFFSIMVEASCCIYFIKFVGKRIDMVYQWFFSCLSCAFVTLVVNLFLGYAFDGIWPMIVGLLLNISATYVLVSACMPLLEQALNLPTAFRLHELAYADSPSLTRLSQVAQGTYNHSRMVADLAYNAATAIGANALLARVGGLYHDIGKSDHPEYFVENQVADNKHDDIKPSLSAAIIKSHVKLGMEKGRDARLPEEVLDIIGEHHGNDVIYFFFNEAKQEAIASDRDIAVSQEDYSYNGNIPNSPEAAIVMLSDCAEAATRTIKRPTTTKYQKLIHQIIMGKITRHQLDDSTLSLTDLEEIANSFVGILIGRDHHRIEYPEEKTPAQTIDSTTRSKG